MTRRSVTEETVATLVASGAAREYLARRHGDGWLFCVRLGVDWLPLRSRREPVRVFASLTALERWATARGVRAVLVEL